MSAMADLAGAELLVDDNAHLLASRALLRCAAAYRDALQACFTSSLDRLGARGVFALHVDEHNDLAADAFLVAFEDDVLIDCDRDDVAELTGRLTGAGVAVQDVSHEWRVFAELPNQEAFDTTPPFVRVADPRRRELGARIYRATPTRESTAWRHEGLYRAHTYKLGIPPRAAVLRRLGIDPFEAHLHVLGALDADHVTGALAAGLQANPRPQRRVLPFRVEPTGLVLADMDAAPLLADGAPVGVAIARQGLWGLGLVDLAPWRAAVAEGVPVRCEGEPVLITWPTWIARESEGRTSPAAQKSRVVTP